MVIHGHAITEQADIRSNRIRIDTGAYRSGRLTALSLESTEHWLIGAIEQDGAVGVVEGV